MLPFDIECSAFGQTGFERCVCFFFYRYGFQQRGWSLFTHWRTMVCWKTGDVWMNGDCRFNLLIMIEKGHRRVFFRFWPWLWNTEGSIYIMMWKKSLQFQVLYISQFTTLLSLPDKSLIISCWLMLGLAKITVSHVSNYIKVNLDHRARTSCNWKKHIRVQKSRNLRGTFGGMFWIREQQTLILGATTVAYRTQKSLSVCCL